MRCAAQKALAKKMAETIRIMEKEMADKGEMKKNWIDYRAWSSWR